MKTKEIRDTIRERMRNFVKKDPRRFPDLYIHILGRRPPQQGHVFLIRKGKQSGRIDTFNSITELGIIVETICQEYRNLKG